MTTRKLLLICSAIAAVAALVGTAWYWQRLLQRSLPQRFVLASHDTALAAARTYAGANGGDVIGVLGTGSMAPFIPAAANPVNSKVIVAYVVTVPRAGYFDVKQGKLCLYHPATAGRESESWMHQAAAKDGGGWIMTGLANKQYESWMRMGPAQFIGIAAAAFVWDIHE